MYMYVYVYVYVCVCVYINIYICLYIGSTVQKHYFTWHLKLVACASSVDIHKRSHASLVSACLLLCAFHIVRAKSTES